MVQYRFRLEKIILLPIDFTRILKYLGWPSEGISLPTGLTKADLIFQIIIIFQIFLRPIRNNLCICYHNNFTKWNTEKMHFIPLSNFNFENWQVFKNKSQINSLLKLKSHWKKNRRKVELMLYGCSDRNEYKYVWHQAYKCGVPEKYY